MAPSADAVIADQAVDLVVICTRHATHAELARQALEAGKHVFCEKPLALTLDELSAALGAARTSPGLLLVGFNRRFSPFLSEARSFLSATEAPVTVQYRVSAGTLSPDHWTHDLAQGGGRILGEVCHFVDCLAFVASSRILTVHAAAHRALDVPVQGADNVVVTLVFENGSVGTITYSARGAPKVGKERLEAFAGERTVVLDDYLEARAARSRSPHRAAEGQDSGQGPRRRGAFAARRHPPRRHEPHPRRRTRERERGDACYRRVTPDS